MRKPKMKKKNSKIPNFGKHREMFQPQEEYPAIELECNYMVPGLTLHDLVQIYHAAHDDPECNEFAGNPSKWPTVNGVYEVVMAVLEAIYDGDPEEEIKGTVGKEEA